MTDADAITIRPMQPADAPAVAALHDAMIGEGFLRRLGRRFLAALYRAIARTPGSAVFVADAGGRVVGFCAYSQDVSAMYRRVLRRRGWRLLLAAIPRLFDPRLALEALDTLRYPSKQAACDLPPAEILAIAVDPQMHGRGVGRRLLAAAIRQARDDGQPALKVLAGEKLEGANRFYQACGFACVARIVQHGEPLNVYVLRLDADAAASTP